MKIPQRSFDIEIRQENDRWMNRFKIFVRVFFPTYTHNYMWRVCCYSGALCLICFQFCTTAKCFLMNTRSDWALTPWLRFIIFAKHIMLTQLVAVSKQTPSKKYLKYDIIAFITIGNCTAAPGHKSDLTQKHNSHILQLYILLIYLFLFYSIFGLMTFSQIQSTCTNRLINSSILFSFCTYERCICVALCASQ